LFLVVWEANLYPHLPKAILLFIAFCHKAVHLSQSIETSMQASRIIKQFDEVKMVVGKTGSAEVPTDPMPPEATDMMIILKPQNEWKNRINHTMN
jgi:cobalt-zinc-cadmium resistance protein CzcA